MADTGYNFGNFLYPGKVETMWYMSTYLSNQLGHFFTMLPFGKTLMGIKFYTALVPASTAMVSYHFFRTRLKAGAIPVTAGLLMAEGLCWCPTTLLYNYLTYFLVTVMVILLYLGITERNGQPRYFFFAGISYGSSIWVRFPNVFQVLFILVLFLHPLFSSTSEENKSDTPAEGLSVPGQFLWCVAGAAAGYSLWLFSVLISGRLGDYISMFSSLLRVSGDAPGYSPADMAMAAINAFAVRWYYIKWLALGLIFGCLLRQVTVRIQKYNKIPCLPLLGASLYMAVLILITLKLTRGNFINSNYTADSSFMSLAAVWLFFMAIMLGELLLRRETPTLALLLILELVILPFGSNNNIYPVVNCLFLMAPFVFLHVGEAFRGKSGGALSLLMAWLSILLFVQSIGTGFFYVFGEGGADSETNTVVRGIPVLEGMHTGVIRSRELQDIYALINAEGLSHMPLLTYGDVPAMSAYLGMEPAISSTWPDLESFSSDTFLLELSSLKTAPVIIIGREIYYKNQGKESALWSYMEKNSYVKTAEYEEYTLWKPRGAN